MAEWLRNPLGSPRAGSNPADYGHMFVLPLFFFQDNNFLTEGFFSLDGLNLTKNFPSEFGRWLLSLLLLFTRLTVNNRPVALRGHMINASFKQ